MASLKDLLNGYFAWYNIDQMSAEQRARYNDMQAHGELNSVMRRWNALYIGRPAPNFTLAPPQGLTNDQWAQLYSLFQTTLQKMYSGRNSTYIDNGAVQTFLQDYFDGTYGQAAGTPTTVSGRLFTINQATQDTTNTLRDLHTFLNSEDRIRGRLLSAGVLPEGMSISDFMTGLSSGRYNNDLKFRITVEKVVGNINYWAGIRTQEYWPISPTGDFSANNLDTRLAALENHFETSAFEIPDISSRRLRFRTGEYADLLNRLVTDEGVQKAFLNEDSTEIGKQLKSALNRTNYNDPKGDNYLAPRTTDVSSLGQRIKTFKSNTYENYLRKFTNPSRGSRLFFTEQAQNIVKAMDKVGVKPTDGLDGILNNKDKILEKIGNSSGETKNCFNWFIEAMTDIKKEIPDAFAGALKNGAQLRAVVSRFIVKSVEKGKVRRARAGLEILSVAKYGMMSSRTLNAVNEGLKDAKLFSDDKLSWNKNEGVKMVTGAIDGTIKAGIKLGALAGTGLYNFVQHRRTKFGTDIRNNPVLARPYQRRRDANNTELTRLRNLEQGAQQNVNQTQNDLNQVITDLNNNNITFNGAQITIDNIGQYLQQLNSLREDHRIYQNNNNDIQNYAREIQRLTRLIRNRTTNSAERRQLQNNLTEQRRLRQWARDNNYDIDIRHNGHVTREYNNRQGELNNLDLYQNVYNNYTAAQNTVQSYQNRINNIDYQTHHDRDDFRNLIAYWDMLESVTRTHAFTLGSMAVRRRMFRQNEAQQTIAEVAQGYDNITTR